MAKLTFVGGIHPYDGKELSKDKPIKAVLPKGDLVYPLSQHIGAPAKPIVAKGDHVLTGQMIAEAGGFGWYCESDDPAKFTACVDAAVTADRQAMGENGYRFLCENYSPEECYRVIVEE